MRGVARRAGVIPLAVGRLGGRGAPPAQTGVRSAGRQDQAFQQTLASWPEVPLGTPATGLSVYSVVPVLKKPRPGVAAGFLPVLASVLIASTPRAAILPGNWAEVAVTSPFFR